MHGVCVFKYKDEALSLVAVKPEVSDNESRNTSPSESRSEGLRGGTFSNSIDTIPYATRYARRSSQPFLCSSLAYANDVLFCADQSGDRLLALSLEATRRDGEEAKENNEDSNR